MTLVRKLIHFTLYELKFNKTDYRSMENYTSPGACGVRWHLQNTTSLIKKIISDLLGCVSHSATIEHTLIFNLDPLCSHNWGVSTQNSLKAQLAAKHTHLPWPSQHSTIYQAFMPGFSTSQPVLARISPPTAGHSVESCQRRKELHSEPARAGCVSPGRAAAVLSLLGCCQFSPG